MAHWTRLTVAVVLIQVLLCGIARADSAEVLPKGVWNVRAELSHSFPITQRYNPDGNAEDLAVDFNKDLNSDVFTDLAALDPVTESLGLGRATIGRSVVSFEYQIDKTEIMVGYGLTDKFSIGLVVPYWVTKNTVSATLDNNANANVGKNPAFNPALPPSQTNPPLIPIVAGGVRLTADDVQNILGGGLYINGGLAIAGFGYKRIETWEGNSFGDIELGGKYQYYKTDDFRFAFTGGVRFPTGKKDDPDSLVDINTGDGAYALLFRLHNDYTGIKNLVLDVTLRYDLILPFHETLRIPDSPNQPITANKENVQLDIGDPFEVETSASYEFAKGWTGSLTYRYTKKPKDEVSGNQGFAYSSLEDESNSTSQIGFVGISYSTLPLYVEKKFPIPLEFSLSYRNRFAGSGNLWKSEYLILGVSAWF